MSGWSAFWTAERVEQLRLWHAQGISFGAIASGFGNRITRNACIGKAQRLGLPARKSGTEDGRRWKPRKSALPLLAEPAPPKPPPPPEPTTATAVTTLELQNGQCKWPLNDGGPFLHCGAQRVEGRPYCAHHLAKAFSRGTRSERDAA